LAKPASERCDPEPAFKKRSLIRFGLRTRPKKLAKQNQLEAIGQETISNHTNILKEVQSPADPANSRLKSFRESSYNVRLHHKVGPALCVEVTI